MILTKEDSIATITLNRPKVLNALHLEAVNEFLTVLEDVEKDETIRAVVITGTGRGFCTGADLIGRSSGSARPAATSTSRGTGGWLVQFHKCIEKITTMQKPVIALINGYAVGAGFDMAIACDIRIAAEDARFSEIFVRRGLLPDSGGTFFLPRLVGVGKAMELIFTGDIINAEEAERIGIINKVVPNDQLETIGMEFVKRLAKGPTKAIGLAKVGVNKALESDLSSALKFARDAMAILAQTEDSREGRRSFAEKREPIFKGK